MGFYGSAPRMSIVIHSMGTFTTYFLKGVCRFLSFPRALKVFDLYTTMTCSRMIMMSFKFSLSKPLGKNNLAISQISSVTFPRLGQSTTFVRQQGLHDTTLRQHIFPQWFSISGFFPSKNNLPVLPSRRWKSRLVLT